MTENARAVSFWAEASGRRRSIYAQRFAWLRSYASSPWKGRGGQPRSKTRGRSHLDQLEHRMAIGVRSVSLRRGAGRHFVEALHAGGEPIEEFLQDLRPVLRG